VNVLVGVVLAVAAGAGAVAIAGSWGGAYPLFGLLVAAFIGVATLQRARNRVGCAGAGLVGAALAIVAARVAHLPAEPGLAPAIGLSVLIGAVVRAEPVRRAAAVAGGGLVVAAGSWLANPGSGGARAVVALNLFTWLGGIAAGLGHDVVAHHVTGIILQAQAAQLVARKDPAKLPPTLAGIQTAAADALTAMRRVIGILRDDEDGASTSPGPETIAELVHRFSRQGGRQQKPQVQLVLPETMGEWREEVTSTVYRVVQESLTNVARHAPHAQAVRVQVTETDGAISVSIVNDGPAPSGPNRLSGYGLIGMRERVESLGGMFEAGQGTNEWSVKATVPR
jgi:hypothetical protein